MLHIVRAMEINNKMRLHFLKNDWKAYPPLPTNSQYWGRVIGFSCLSDNNFTLSTLQLEIQSLQVEDFFQEKKIKINYIIKCDFWSQVLVPGDIIAVDNFKELTLLAPNLRSEEYRPQVNQNKWHHINLWNHYLQLVRNFFCEKGFVAFSTPLLVKHPGSEPTLEPFKTKLKVGTQDFDIYLPTSPELNLKKVLTTGVPRLFEITKSFRNNEHSERHSPEFWILEWYRNFSNLEEIKNDVQELITYLCQHLRADLPTKFSGVEFASESFSKIFWDKYQFSFTPSTSLAELKDFCEKENIQFVGEDSIEDLFSVITIERIESQLLPERITFLENYPPYAAALARTSTEGWAQRFEVYWKGLELANAFYELNDPEEQRRRFHQDNNQKIKNKLEVIPLDEDFLVKLETGLPPCAGIALGLERLFMALFDLQSIHDLTL